MSKSFFSIIALPCLMLFGFVCNVFSQTNSSWEDVTSSYIVNPRYDNNSNSGWTINANSFSKACSQGAQEFWNGTWSISQTISNVPAGHYRVTVNAFHRYSQNSSTAVTNSQQGKEDITSFLCANGKKVALKSVYSESLTSNATNQCWGYQGVYYPNTMTSAAYCFNNNMYVNTLEFDVTDGKITLEIRNDTFVDANWCIMDNWKLEREAYVSSEENLAKLMINEIQTSNIDQNIDPSYNYGAWMEIYNPNDKAVDLKGCYVSDDELNPCKDVIRNSLVIPSHGVGCVWFGHQSRYAKGQIRFTPSHEAGILMLTSPAKSLIASQTFDIIAPRTSMARTTDGGAEWGITSTPTPGKSNAGCSFATERIAAPLISEQSSLSKTSKSFVVEIPAGTTLKYTTDGSAPSVSNGSVSNDGKFTCTSTTCYRFCLVANDKLSSPVVTRTFIINSRNHSIPVISIVSDNKHFYGNELGVFTQGTNGCPGRGRGDNCNWNMEWDRPVNFEFFDKDGVNRVNMETALERCGGWSRAWLPYSFKIKANKEYELQNYLPYQFFPNKPYLKHKALQIRNGGNDNVCRFKDPALQMIVGRSGFYIDYQEYVPVHHYINGRYAGVINMREPNNKLFAYSNYGIDDDLVDQFEMSPDSNYVQMEGTKDSFNRWYQLSSNCGTNLSDYDEICKMVDIDSYCNYMAVEFFLGGFDWPQNNIKGFREPVDGSKFHFVLFDLDGAFATESPFTAFKNKKNYTFDMLYGIDWKGNSIYGQRISGEIMFVTIFCNMLKNETFRKKFIDTFCIIAGSVFDPTRCANIINELSAAVKSQMQQGSEVYGQGSSPDNTAYELKTKLTSSRTEKLITALKSFSDAQIGGATAKKVTSESSLKGSKLLINGIVVPEGKFSGKVFLPANLSALAPRGYRFRGWEKNGEIISTEAVYELKGSAEEKISPSFEVMKDEAIAAYGHPTSPVVINEVSAGNTIYINDYDKKDDWIELFNTTDKDIDLEGAYITDNTAKPKKCLITAGASGASTIIPAKGYKLIWCGKRETDKELHASFKLENNEGCAVRIQAADNSWSDEFKYGTMRGDETFGRYPDGLGDVYKLSHPTILADNMLLSGDELKISAESTTGVSNVTLGDAMKAWITENVLIIENAKEDIRVNILSLSGTRMFSTSAKTSGNHTKISLPTLPSAVYLVEVISGNERITFKSAL